MVLFRSGVAGARGYSPKGIILHNDAGSQAANAAFYRNWLPNHQAENGFAHYYIGSDGTYQAELDSNKAWHCGNSTYNRDYIGIEACQSMGNQATLLANEQESFKLMATLCKKYGIVPNRTTILLHKEVSSTACPHRSWALNGQSVNAVKDYFIAQIVKYMTGAASEPAKEETKTTKGVATMFELFKVKGNDTIYFFNGQRVVALSMLDQVVVLQRIYKENNGKDLEVKEYDRAAPWYLRILETTTNPSPTAETFA